MICSIEQQPRLLWADIVKFWGILAIVWGHTLSDGAVRLYLYSFHVPLFFFATGLYFDPTKISFGRFWQKKAIALLVPYFAFAVISILIFSVLGELASSSLGADVADFSLRANLLEMLTGQCRANRPLWFLPCMFIFYILCFGVSKLTEKYARLRTVIYTLLIVLSVSLCLLNSILFKINALIWKADVAVFMLSFCLAATLARPHFAQFASNWISLTVGILFLALGCILAFQNSAVGYLDNHYGNVLLFYSSASCTVLGLCLLSMFLAQRKGIFWNKVLTYAGQKTLPILLMHKFPILFFQVLFPWTKQPLKNNNPYVGFAVAIVSIAGCLIVDLVLGIILTKIKGRKDAEK